MTVVGRRERKKLATRTALREAALHLALRHGVEHVTVDQIAAEADIAVRTFFNYFSSKEEAMVAGLAAEADALITEFRARPRAEPVLRALREAVVTVMAAGDLPEQIDALRLVVRAPSLVPQRLAVYAAREKALAEAIADRLGLEDSLYPALCAATALTAMRLVLERWLDHPASMTVLREQIDEAIGHLAAGMERTPQ
ncbi:TetR/AcrR family transcriptional regulator [Herbidospora mongoliensis]|uniref:TetR/AcrR family transcriptional regulator n=1 Tax=Herbidospora mongoliensis TaxID=688067 RepID=UPI0008323D0F|nr:TetR family transcriptional regulator [Herbidospora mongoliensis]